MSMTNAYFCYALSKILNLLKFKRFKIFFFLQTIGFFSAML